MICFAAGSTVSMFRQEKFHTHKKKFAKRTLRQLENRAVVEA